MLLIDAMAAPVHLKDSAVDLFRLVADNTPDWSMIYSDYEVDTDGVISEEHLLDHHPGRLRDAMDYGAVWFLNNNRMQGILPLQEDVVHGALYDLRLRLSEVGELVHVASRYAGGLYTVARSSTSTDVFAYLRDGKARQLDYEKVVSGHLRRVGAFLELDAYYREVSYRQMEYPLKASVIIPVNHRPEFIAAAIESVLGQTVQEVEVIVVVNGGADDPTVPVVRSYQEGGQHFRKDAPDVGLIVVDINNIGFCLNTGLNQSQGRVYVQLDSDDQLAPDAIEKILAVYDQDPTIGMVIGSYEVWEKQADGSIERMESIPVVTHAEWTAENGRNNLLRINGAGAPRSFYVDLARDLGYLDMNVTPYARNYGEDYQFVLRMSEEYRIGRVWDPIYKVIRHGGGTDHAIDRATIDRNDNAKDQMRLEAIQRRKKMNEGIHG